MINLEKRLKAHGVSIPSDLCKENKLTQEIVLALLEVKLMREGKVKSLTIKDI